MRRSRRASSRASASDTSATPPKPMSHRFDFTSVRNIQLFDPVGATSRYSPPPSAYRPGSFVPLAVLGVSALWGCRPARAIPAPPITPTNYVGTRRKSTEDSGQYEACKHNKHKALQE